MKQQKVREKVGWKFDNSYANLPELFFTILNPSPVPMPKLIKFNDSLADYLGLDVQALMSGEGPKVFAGNHIPEKSLPLAQAYAGHQFGRFTMLGDGRAILLGEQITPENKRFDIQLKGSGRTPYSRGGDGKATLGSMLREYIISEAMYALGIPTTRSLAVVTTGENIMRETLLPGAVLTRVSSSHLRVGTFQYAAQWGTKEDIKALADYTLEKHFEGFDEDNPYLYLLKEVVNLQADLIAKWQLIGFVHGVMNTDNMALSGETIDYGPCAFMDTYDPETVFSSIDKNGRYAYGNQPDIGLWNLARFAETLLPLIHENEDQAIQLAQEVLSDYFKLYYNNWLSGMRRKIGLFNVEAEDESLIELLLKMMKKYSADYTNTFLAITFNNFEDTNFYNTEEFGKWYGLWKERLNRQEESESSSQALMRNNNPAIIPRNHRVEEALEAAVEQGDLKIMDELLEALSKPYAHSSEQSKYATLPEPSDCPYRTYCGT